MDFTSANHLTPTATTIKTPDTDTEPPSPSEPKSISNRSLSFPNGSLKPHHPTIPPPQPPPTMAVAYKECLKNHAASLGGHALDGCGEFMPSPSSNPMDPTSLKCAACGCHRNFHRRDQHRPKNVLSHHRLLLPAPPTHHQHHHSSSPSPTQSPVSSQGPTLSPQSPPPVSHLPPSYFASPPQMLLALSNGVSGPSDGHHHGLHPTTMKAEKYPNEKKRSRTKFSQEQKEKMNLFAEKVGWRMQRSDERLVEDFCNEVGVRRGVFKVWMHNNKHGLKKRSERSGDGGERMIISNVKYETSNGDDESCGRVGFDSIVNAQTTSYNVNAIPQNGGTRASFHLSNNGSSSSS
ncbi:zinc-finger homeodomain protein 11-like [Prunus avium]|uniref:Zinc-finger homeodomain protein 11-like n=1 Tax=Prunus avium TaxID=42229 RepID=A0A6P5S1W0_PRUAV|nr:zinc-finger homeodomain protein 11-like [Prunus avium]